MKRDDRLLGPAWYGADLDIALAGLSPQVHWLGWRRRKTKLAIRAAVMLAAQEARIASLKKRR